MAFLLVNIYVCCVCACGGALIWKLAGVAETLRAAVTDCIASVSVAEPFLQDLMMVVNG